MASTTLTGLGGIDTRDFRSFAKALRSGARSNSTGLRKRLRAAGEVVAADARRRASWSTTIPPTIKVQVRGVSVLIVAGGSGAPFAAAMEDGSKGNRGTNRHPVFAAVGSPEYKDPARWVNQPTRPYLGPAVEANRDAVAAAVLAALDETIRVVVTAYREG